MTYEDKQKLSKMINDYYSYECAGGALHIVLDDGNIEDSHIQWCIDNSIKEKNDEAALEIANELLKLSYSARKKMYNNDWNV